MRILKFGLNRQGFYIVGDKAFLEHFKDGLSVDVRGITPEGNYLFTIKKVSGAHKPYEQDGHFRAQTTQKIGETLQRFRATFPTKQEVVNKMIHLEIGEILPPIKRNYKNKNKATSNEVVLDIDLSSAVSFINDYAEGHTIRMEVLENKLEIWEKH
jgi:hypothetical protein